LRKRELARALAARLQPARPLALAAVAAAALAASACGGSSNSFSASTSGPRLSKSQLIKKADSVCFRWNYRNSLLRANTPTLQPFAKTATQKTREKTASILRRYAANVGNQVDELSPLNPPETMQSDWQAALGRMNMFSKEIHTAADAAKKGDKSAYANAISDAVANSSALKPLFTRYGFRACGGVG
jgi:hypothetical protein